MLNCDLFAAGAPAAAHFGTRGSRPRSPHTAETRRTYSELPETRRVKLCVQDLEFSAYKCLGIVRDYRKLNMKTKLA